MPLQWRNQIWQSLEEGAGKRCSEFGILLHTQARPPRGNNEFRLDSNEFGFICAGVSNVGGYERNAFVVFYKLTTMVLNQRTNFR